jgi:hypothetical protein
MITATKKENTIAADALAGIGLMYGPISPETNIIGNSATMMVRVAMMVGLPTSATASIAAWIASFAPRAQCRAMFSTTTMASSTRMPIEKISANRLTRLMVKPISQEANRVSRMVVGITTMTTMPSRQPSAIAISTTIETVASARWNRSSLALSSAVAP